MPVFDARERLRKYQALYTAKNNQELRENFLSWYNPRYTINKRLNKNEPKSLVETKEMLVDVVKCEQCSTIFYSKSNKSLNKPHFCAVCNFIRVACSKKISTFNSGSRKETKKCSWCYKSFKPLTSKKMCSTECISKYRKHLLEEHEKIKLEKYEKIKKDRTRSCNWCGKMFNSGCKKSKTCSPECRSTKQQARNVLKYYLLGNYKKEKPKIKKCSWCGSLFKLTRSNNKLCSINCKRHQKCVQRLIRDYRISIK
jgi:hypothetical protein